MTTICPVCNRTVKITKGGKFAVHGHSSKHGHAGRTLGGMLVARCYGSNATSSTDAKAKAVRAADYYLEGYRSRGETHEQLEAFRTRMAS